MIESKTRISLLLILMLMTASCQRPFVEPQLPALEIESDLSRVFSTAQLTLVVRASAYRGVDHVEVNGDTLLFNEDQEVWRRDVTLHEGFNRLILTATDLENQTTRDTVYAIRDVLSIDGSAPSLPEGRGGHTTTLLQDGTVLVTGGAQHAGAAALRSAVAWAPGTDSFSPIPDLMLSERTGHTATLLPDGRVLLLGGSRIDEADGLEDMVEIVELFDPESGTFVRLPFDDDPIRRTLHTTALLLEGGRTYIDVYGGRGDLGGAFGTRRDLRRFEFRNDSLFALHPSPGPALDAAVAGHTQTKLDASTPRFLIAGTYFAVGVEEDVGFVLDYDVPGPVGQRPTNALMRPRTRHASALLEDGFVVTFGGRRALRTELVTEAEIYAEEADRPFVYPQSSLLPGTYGLTATKLQDQRILLLGGFSSSGQSFRAPRVYRAPRLQARPAV